MNRKLFLLIFSYFCLISTFSIVQASAPVILGDLSRTTVKESRSQNEYPFQQEKFQVVFKSGVEDHQALQLLISNSALKFVRVNQANPYECPMPAGRVGINALQFVFSTGSQPYQIYYLVEYDAVLQSGTKSNPAISDPTSAAQVQRSFMLFKKVNEVTSEGTRVFTEDIGKIVVGGEFKKYIDEVSKTDAFNTKGVLRLSDIVDVFKSKN